MCKNKNASVQNLFLNLKALRYNKDLIVPEVDYSLAPLDWELMPALNELYQWDSNHMQNIDFSDSSG